MQEPRAIALFGNSFRKTPFRKMFMIAAIIVVFITTYMLILPAITMGNGHDFSGWITSSTIKVGGGSTQTISSGASYTVNRGDALQFQITYKVPGGKLSPSTTDTIYYQLPFGINNAESGNVRDESGTQAGTYTISANGLITIVFNSDFVSKNAAGGEIKGTIAFNSSVSKIVSSGQTQGSSRIGNNSFTLKINENDTPAQESLLSISGTAGTPTETTVPITFTITSAKGTGGNSVNVDISNTNGSLSGNVNVTKNGSNQYVNVSNSGNGFSMTLPAMNANDKYIITFTLKRTVDFTETVDEVYVTSNATAKAGSSQVNAQAGGKFSNRYLTLTGSAKGGYVNWTIDVNPDRKDIAGYTLTDQYLNRVTATDSDFKINWNQASNYSGSDLTLNKTGSGNVSNIRFNGANGSTNNNEYNISYSVPMTMSIGANTFSNKANLTKNAATYSAASTVAATYSPVSGSADSKKVNADNTLTLNWNANIEPEALGNDWVYVMDTSNSSADHVFTANDIKGLQSTLGNDYTVYAVVNGQEVAATGIGSGSGITSTTVKVKAKKASTAPLSFKYSTTASLADVDSPQSYNVNTYIAAYPDAAVGVGNSYTPAVINKNDKGEQKVDDIKNNDGVIKYDSDIRIPDDVQGDVVITDTIPEGTDIDSIKLGITSIPNKVGTYTYTVGWNQYYDGDVADVEVTITEDGQISMKIPQKMYSGRSIPYSLGVKANTLDEIPAGDSETYRNEIVIRDSMGVEITTFGTSMTVTNPIETLSKFGNQSDEFVNYTVKVNPAEILGPGETHYQIIDNLEYNVYNPAWSFEIVPGSLKIYKADGVTPLSTFLYSYSYGKIENGQDTGWSGMSYRTLTIDVDYDQPIVLSYTYKIVSANYNNATGEVKNKVILKNGDKVYEGETYSIPNVRNQKSSASAIVEGFNIYKVDADNQGAYLSNAKFKLWKYNGSTYEFDKDLTTDVNGKINLVVTADTAYYITEVVAPDGYQLDSTPHYFWYSEGSSSPNKAPGGFNGEKVTNNQNLFITNKKKPSAQILIQKHWIDAEGKEIAPSKVTVPSITFDLYYSVYGDLSQDEVRTRATKYQLSDNQISGSLTDQWMKMISGLPIADQYGNRYYYYVVENEVPGYTASYVYKTVSDTDTLRYSQVAISNQEAPVGYELPHTGGKGTIVIVFSGGVMMTVSALLMIYLRKKQEGEA